MTHIFTVDSAESLIILDALKIMVKDPEVNLEDREEAERLFRRIIDIVEDDLKGVE